MGKPPTPESSSYDLALVNAIQVSLEKDQGFHLEDISLKWFFDKGLLDGLLEYYDMKLDAALMVVLALAPELKKRPKRNMNGKNGFHSKNGNSHGEFYDLYGSPTAITGGTRNAETGDSEKKTKKKAKPSSNSDSRVYETLGIVENSPGTLLEEDIDSLLVSLPLKIVRNRNATEPSDIFEQFPRLPYRIANKFFYGNDSLEKITAQMTAEISKMNRQSEQVVREGFEQIRIALWHGLPMQKYDTSVKLRTGLMIHPQLDLKTIQNCYRKYQTEEAQRKNKLANDERIVLNLFFGLDGKIGFFNTILVAHELGISESIVRETLVQALRTIESEEKNGDQSEANGG